MDPAAILKSVLEMLGLKATSVPPFVAWIVVAITALFILAGVIASVREITGLWPRLRILGLMSRIRFRSPMFCAARSVRSDVACPNIRIPQSHKSPHGRLRLPLRYRLPCR